VKEFDEEILTVKGLEPSEKYILKIDGNIINTLTGAQWNKGINLALLSNTPQYQQSKRIMEIQLKRKDLEDKLRSFYWISYDYLYDKGWFMKDSKAITDSVMAAAKTNPFINGKKDAYLETHEKSQRNKIQQQMNEMAEEMYRIAKPVEHIIAIEKND
jgi:hypothetical protein